MGKVSPGLCLLSVEHFFINLLKYLWGFSHYYHLGSCASRNAAVCSYTEATERGPMDGGRDAHSDYCCMLYSIPRPMSRGPKRLLLAKLITSNIRVNTRARRPERPVEKCNGREGVTALSCLKQHCPALNSPFLVSKQHWSRMLLILCFKTSVSCDTTPLFSGENQLTFFRIIGWLSLDYTAVSSGR